MWQINRLWVKRWLSVAHQSAQRKKAAGDFEKLPKICINCSILKKSGTLLHSFKNYLYIIKLIPLKLQWSLFLRLHITLIPEHCHQPKEISYPSTATQCYAPWNLKLILSPWSCLFWMFYINDLWILFFFHLSMVFGDRCMCPESIAFYDWVVFHHKTAIHQLVGI